MKAGQIPALTGLRFFAAMAIVLTHSEPVFFKPGTFALFNLPGGVELFFVLSGFVLTIGFDNKRTWDDFFVARFARIWPTHIAAILFWFAIFYPYTLDALRHAASLGLLFVNGLLLQDWSSDPATYLSYNAPSWSLSAELFFYAVFPIAFVLLWKNTFTKLTALVFATFCGVLLAASFFPSVSASWLGGMSPFASFPEFATGVAAGLWHRGRPATKTTDATGTGLQLAALSLALLANAGFLHLTPHPTAIFYEFVAGFGPAPFYALLILALARHDGVVSRVLSWRPVVYGGQISFGIYLFHQLILRWHSTAYQVQFKGVPMEWQYAGVLAAIFLTAAVAHHMIEMPTQRAILAAWRALRARQLPLVTRQVPTA